MTIAGSDYLNRPLRELADMPEREEPVELTVFDNCHACNGEGVITWTYGVIDRNDGSLIEYGHRCEACNGTGIGEIETEPADTIEDLDERCGDAT